MILTYKLKHGRNLSSELRKARPVAEVVINSFTKSKVHLMRVWALLNIPIQLAQVFLLIYISIKQNGNTLFWWIIPILFVITLIVWWLDAKFLYRAEIDYGVEHTSAWKKLQNDVGVIKSDLQALKAAKDSV